MRALLVGVCGYFYLQVRGPAVANQRRIDSASLFTYFSRGPDPPCHKGSQSSIGSRHSRPCHLSFLEAFRGSKQGSIDRSASTLFTSTTGLASGLWKRAAFCIQSLVDDRRGQGVRAPAGLSACLKYSYFQGHTRSIVCRLCQHRPGTRSEKRGQRAVRGVRKAVVVEGG